MQRYVCVCEEAKEMLARRAYVHLGDLLEMLARRAYKNSLTINPFLLQTLDRILIPLS